MLMADHYRLVHPYNRDWVLTIDDLPDDVLLEIFDFYVPVVRYQDLNSLDSSVKWKIESWKSLVHVSRRWRCLVFGSPRRLNLQLFHEITGWGTQTVLPVPVDVWPKLPLIISGSVFERTMDNVIAELRRHSDRISQINLRLDFYVTSLDLWMAMTIPFPELVGLDLSHGSFLARQYGSVLPDSLLGGSAPRLRNLFLRYISFPGLPKLLLSTTHLVNLHIKRIPHSGYISPEALVTCLSMLTKLEEFQLGFDSLESFPDPKSRRPFPPTRLVLPTLTKFWFQGVAEYFEDFVAQIDTPQLYRLSTMIYDRKPELHQFKFISRTPTLGEYDESHLVFRRYGARVRLCRQSHPLFDDIMVDVVISCQDANQQLSFTRKICIASLPLPLLKMNNIYIDGDIDPPLAHGDAIDMENTDSGSLGVFLFDPLQL